MAMSGCSTITLSGVPAHRLPRWLQAEPRANRQPINLIRLRQDPPAVYLLGPRDILGIFIQGVLGREEEAPPVHFPIDGNTPPALGFPIPIREDGTLALPLIDPVKVSGLTLAQAENEIRNEYLRKGILIPGQDRIIVTMIRKRTYQIVVVREDIGSQQAVGGVGLAGPSKRGSAYSIDLEAYENDVMHALAATGGLPGLDAKNEILILRWLTSANARLRLILMGIDPPLGSLRRIMICVGGMMLPCPLRLPPKLPWPPPRLPPVSPVEKLPPAKAIAAKTSRS